MVLDCEFEHVSYRCYWKSLDNYQENCMLQKQSLLISCDCIFFQFFLFVFFLQKRDEIAFIIHCFLAQGEGNNVCCKRTITVIFRTVISICKFQTISYFSHYLQRPLSRCLLGASTSFSVVFFYHNLWNFHLLTNQLEKAFCLPPMLHKVQVFWS